MKEDFENAQTIQELVDNANYMVLGTVMTDKSSISRPHNSPVLFEYGPNNCFYWLSTLESQHSQNIMQNSFISALIMDTTHQQGAGYAVYMEGKATLFHASNNVSQWGELYHFNHAVRMLCEKSQTLKNNVDELRDSNSPRKLFRFKVKKASINGGVLDSKTGLWVDQRRPISFIHHPIGRGFSKLKITA